MPRSDCFCGFKEGDTNCYVSDADKCPAVDDCRLGAKATADGVVFSKMNEAERLQAEEKITEMKKGGGANKRPVVADSAAPSRPGAASGGADLTDLESSLSDLGASAGGAVSTSVEQKVKIEAPAPKKKGRRSKVQIAADEAAAKVTGEQTVVQDISAKVEQQAVEKVVPPIEEPVKVKEEDPIETKVVNVAIEANESSNMINNFLKGLMVAVSEAVAEYSLRKAEEIAATIDEEPTARKKRGPNKNSGKKRGPKKGKKKRGKKKK